MTAPHGYVKELPATEAELTALLERKHARGGNGGAGEYAFLAQLRNDAGFSATRTFDAAAVSLWPSRGFTLHIYEIKVSKSDWKRELAKPAKAEDACKIADYFTIVAPRGCVDVNEVPPTWGYIEAAGGKLVDGRVEGRKLRTIRTAPCLTKKRRQEFPAGLVISMLRSAGAVPDTETPNERLIRDAVAAGKDEVRTLYEKRLTETREQDQALWKRVREFGSITGIQLQPSSYGSSPDITAVANKVRAALSDEVATKHANAQLRRLRDDLTRALGETP